MDDGIKREIGILKGEEIRSLGILEDGKEKFSDDLMAGLGEEMTDYLKNPPKENKLLKHKVIGKRKFSNFKRKLSKLLFGEKNGEDL